MWWKNWVWKMPFIYNNPSWTECFGHQMFRRQKNCNGYPILVEKILKENNVSAEIHEINGSVEIAPALGPLADVVADLVSSSSTLL